MSKYLRERSLWRSDPCNLHETSTSSIEQYMYLKSYFHADHKQVTLTPVVKLPSLSSQNGQSKPFQYFLYRTMSWLSLLIKFASELLTEVCLMTIFAYTYSVSFNIALYELSANIYWFTKTTMVFRLVNSL